MIQYPTWGYFSFRQPPTLNDVEGELHPERFPDRLPEGQQHATRQIRMRKMSRTPGKPWTFWRCGQRVAKVAKLELTSKFCINCELRVVAIFSFWNGIWSATNLRTILMLQLSPPTWLQLAQPQFGHKEGQETNSLCYLGTLALVVEVSWRLKSMNWLHIGNPKTLWDSRTNPSMNFPAEFLILNHPSDIHPPSILGAVPPKIRVRLHGSMQPCSAKGNAGPVSVKEKRRNIHGNRPFAGLYVRVGIFMNFFMKFDIKDLGNLMSVWNHLQTLLAKAWSNFSRGTGPIHGLVYAL